MEKVSRSGRRCKCGLFDFLMCGLAIKVTLVFSTSKEDTDGVLQAAKVNSSTMKRAVFLILFIFFCFQKREA